MINEADGNPAANQLPSGLNPDQLEKAVAVSGYPLQRVVAEQLSRDFKVTEEWGFLDRESGEHRTLDVLAYRSLRETVETWLSVALLIECKRSDLPYVFFEAAAPIAPRDFPIVAGLGGKTPDVVVVGIASRASSVAEILRLADLPFVSKGPPVCSSFARAERKGNGLDLSGSVPFNQVILPLISALHHFAKQQKDVGSRTAISACLAVPICVVDGPMVLVKGGPEDSQLSMCPWVRVVRQEAVEERQWLSSRLYVVDFVHRSYLGTFVLERLLPFAEVFADRASSAQGVLRAGKAGVPSLEQWSLADVRAVPAAG
jgi:hypothetical protein